MSEPAQAHTRYSAVAIVLHWLIAAAIVFQVIIAWRMGGGRTPRASPSSSSTSRSGSPSCCSAWFGWPGA